MEGLALKCESTELSPYGLSKACSSASSVRHWELGWHCATVTAAVLRLVLGDMFVHKGFAFISGKHTPKVTLGRSQ